jgi:hypothetical protein
MNVASLRCDKSIADLGRDRTAATSAAAPGDVGFSVPDQLQVNTLIVYSEALFTATPRTHIAGLDLRSQIVFHHILLLKVPTI